MKLRSITAAFLAALLLVSLPLSTLRGHRRRRLDRGVPGRLRRDRSTVRDRLGRHRGNRLSRWSSERLRHRRDRDHDPFDREHPSAGRVPADHPAARRRGTAWTSGRAETKLDYKPSDGSAMRMECKLAMPDVHGEEAKGYWPACWALGATQRTQRWDWPASGEPDIAESVNGVNRNWSTLHCGYAAQWGGPCAEPVGLTNGGVAPEAGRPLGPAARVRLRVGPFRIRGRDAVVRGLQTGPHGPRVPGSGRRVGHPEQPRRLPSDSQRGHRRPVPCGSRWWPHGSHPPGSPDVRRLREDRVPRPGASPESVGPPSASPTSPSPTTTPSTPPDSPSPTPLADHQPVASPSPSECAPQPTASHDAGPAADPNQTAVIEAENYASQQGVRSADGAVQVSNGDLRGLRPRLRHPGEEELGRSRRLRDLRRIQCPGGGPPGLRDGGTDRLVRRRDTGGWTSYRDIPANVAATTGRHRVFLTVKSAGDQPALRIDKFVFGVTPAVTW